MYTLLFPYSCKFLYKPCSALGKQLEARAAANMKFSAIGECSLPPPVYLLAVSCIKVVTLLDSYMPSLESYQLIHTNWVWIQHSFMFSTSELLGGSMLPFAEHIKALSECGSDSSPAPLTSPVHVITSRCKILDNHCTYMQMIYLKVTFISGY
jgi:hypothetical protein